MAPTPPPHTAARAAPPPKANPWRSCRPPPRLAASASVVLLMSLSVPCLLFVKSSFLVDPSDADGARRRLRIGPWRAHKRNYPLASFADPKSVRQRTPDFLSASPPTDGDAARFRFDARGATSGARTSDDGDDPLFRGRWIWNESAEAAYTVNPSYLSGSDRSPYFYGRGKCAPRNFERRGQLQWETETNLDLASPEIKRAVCLALKGKKILFVGDSITGQTHTSFVHLLGLAGPAILHPHPPASRRSREVFHTTHTCAHGEETVSVTFVRNELLSLEAPKKKAGNQYVLDWLPLAEEHDILVLNSGRHQRSDPEYRMQMNEAFHWLKNNARDKDTVAFFLSTKIDNANGMPVVEGATASACSTEFGPYNGMDKIPGQNDFVKRMAAREEFRSVVEYLDFSCLDLRNADRYADAAHSCLPGPVDYRALLFMTRYLMAAKPQWFVR